MIEQIKVTKKIENDTLQMLFNAVPTHKIAWENLQKTLTENNKKQIINLENLNYLNKQFADVLKNINDIKILNLQQIKEDHKKKVLLNKETFKKQKSLLKDDFFNEQNEIKANLESIEDKNNQKCLQFNKKITQIKSDFAEEILILKNTSKENKSTYLNKVSAVYNFKELEKERITSKFHDQIQDYHQKNKQRITQNTLKISEEETFLENYLNFHEKDEVYTKQNYLKTITNLNDKIHYVTNKYKEIEEKIENTFIVQNKELLLNLDDKKTKIEELINAVLDQYEKEYQEIDTNLDSIREKYHKEEINLKNKYNRQITSININLHNNKEDINSLFADLKGKTREDKSKIINLNRKLRLVEKDAKKQIKLAKKEYKTNHNKASKTYTTAHEINLFKRKLAENDKNIVVDHYNTLYSLEENYSNDLIKFTKVKNNIKKEIINNYLQLEISPLESQNELANHIYNLELKLQKIEIEYLYLKTSKRKQLATLKSLLHKYNLEKTKNRIQFYYDLELTTSNLTNYLQMEKEKNELVFQNRLIKLQKESKQALANQKTLEVEIDISLNNLQKKHKIDFLNLSLQNKIEIKNFNDDLIAEKNNYFVKQQNLLKKHQSGQLGRKEFINNFEKEKSYFNDVLNSYRDFYNLISVAEKEIIDVFVTNTPKNTNFDDFQMFLTATKKLLLSKNDILKISINNLHYFLEEHKNKTIANFLEPQLNTYKNTINDYYYKQVDTSLKDREMLCSRANQAKTRINELKNSLSSLKEHLNYSHKTVIYSNKELKNLKKAIDSEKNNKIIKDLNEHILINKKFQLEKAIEKKDLTFELKKEKHKLKKLNKSIKKINIVLNKKEKHKNKSLSTIQKFINNQIIALNEFLKKANALNSSFERTNNSYLKSLDTLTFDHLSIKKTQKMLLNSFREKHNFLINCFNSLYSFKHAAFKRLNKNYLKHKKLETKKENKELYQLNKVHTKSITVINKQVKKTKTKYKKDLKHLNKKETKEINNLKNDNLKRINTADALIKNIDESIIKHEQNYKALKIAFEINKQESLLKDKEILKKDYRSSLKQNQKDIKDTKHNIKRITTDMEYDEKKHKTHLNYLLNQDKQIRKKILQKQNANKNYLSLHIYNLRRKIPKINLEVRYLKARKTLNETQVLKLIRKNNSELNFINKVFLRINIWKKTKKIKKDFQKTFK